jgi:hypothetical protein
VDIGIRFHPERGAAEMRRLIMLAVVTAALALPVAAFAAHTDTGFTLPTGAGTSRAFRIHVARTGRVQVTFRFSDVVNPHGRFRVTIRKLSWSTPVVMLDTKNRSNCQGAAGSIYCYASRTVRRGTYIIRVRKLTVKAAPVELRMSWPS